MLLACPHAPSLATVAIFNWLIANVPETQVTACLNHGDVGFHNLAVDPDTYTVRGIFDYENASWADRHHDFRYLLFDTGHDEMLDAAVAVYEPAVGHTLSRDRIRLFNAAAAASFLAYRDGYASVKDLRHSRTRRRNEAAPRTRAGSLRACRSTTAGSGRCSGTAW